jgi:D-arabinose 1-dehydrogenase-like Zn-dependent alcohol dehydrogenase
MFPRMPLTLGHENAGTVAALGSGVTTPLERINEIYGRLKRGEVEGRAVITPAP